VVEDTLGNIDDKHHSNRARMLCLEEDLVEELLL
jgi:hypothetical protein